MYIYMFSSLIFSVFDSSALSTIHTTYTSAHTRNFNFNSNSNFLICGFFDPIFNLFLFSIQLVHWFGIACVRSTVCLCRELLIQVQNWRGGSERTSAKSIDSNCKQNGQKDRKWFIAIESFNNKSIPCPMPHVSKNRGKKFDICACMPMESL